MSDLDVGIVQLQGLAGIGQSIAVRLCLEVGKTPVAIECSYSWVQLYGLGVVINSRVIPTFCRERIA